MSHAPSPRLAVARFRLTRALVLALTLSAWLTACSYGYSRPYDGRQAPAASFAARPALPAPAMNPTTAAKVALGRALFHDRRLSADGSLACASCHAPDQGFGDGRATAVGIGGQRLARHSPQLWNVAFAPRLFGDGRAASLEAQALMPVTNPAEMGHDLAALERSLSADPAMRTGFARAFPGTPVVSAANVARAIAAYERTLVSGQAPFDRWAAGDRAALSPAAARGFALFAGKGRCAECHSGWAFSDGRFHDIGLADSDRGRGAVTGARRDAHAFRTPSLREVALSPPYMHDGSLPSLAAVVDHYADHVAPRARAPRRAALDAGERADLVAFLDSLTSDADAN